MDVNVGIGGDSFPDRTEFFGNNYREPLKAKSFCKIFFEALDDFMLKVLIVAATGSLIFEYIGADPEDYGHGKCSDVIRAVRAILWLSGAWHPDGFLRHALCDGTDARFAEIN